MLSSDVCFNCGNCKVITTPLITLKARLKPNIIEKILKKGTGKAFVYHQQLHKEVMLHDMNFSDIFLIGWL